MAVLQQAAAVYRAGGVVTVQVTGYTDTSGSARYNLRLSARRAKHVAYILVRMGVPWQAIADRGRRREQSRRADAGRRARAAQPPRHRRRVAGAGAARHPRGLLRLTAQTARAPRVGRPLLSLPLPADAAARARCRGLRRLVRETPDLLDVAALDADQLGRGIAARRVEIALVVDIGGARGRACSRGRGAPCRSAPRSPATPSPNRSSPFRPSPGHRSPRSARDRAARFAWRPD